MEVNETDLETSQRESNTSTKWVGSAVRTKWLIDFLRLPPPPPPPSPPLPPFLVLWAQWTRLSVEKESTMSGGGGWVLIAITENRLQDQHCVLTCPRLQVYSFTFWCILRFVIPMQAVKSHQQPCGKLPPITERDEPRSQVKQHRHSDQQDTRRVFHRLVVRRGRQAAVGTPEDAHRIASHAVWRSFRGRCGCPGRIHLVSQQQTVPNDSRAGSQEGSCCCTQQYGDIGECEGYEDWEPEESCQHPTSTSQPGRRRGLHLCFLGFHCSRCVSDFAVVVSRIFFWYYFACGRYCPKQMFLIFPAFKVLQIWCIHSAVREFFMYP